MCRGGDSRYLPYRKATFIEVCNRCETVTSDSCPRRLSDRTAIVTGAGSGNGRAIALRFAAEGAGVLVADVNGDSGLETVQSIRADGGRAEFRRVNVADTADLDSLVDSAVEWGGRLDIMVNNAGINLRNPLLDIVTAEWQRLIDVNLKGVFFGTQSAARAMIKSGSGKIVNISSIREEVAGLGNIAYCAAKGGVRMLTRAAALELAEHKINVNAVGPGYVETNMTRGLLSNPQVLSALIASVPWGRLAVPEEVAAAVAFLASDESDFITGTTLYVDGGHLTA